MTLGGGVGVGVVCGDGVCRRGAWVCGGVMVGVWWQALGIDDKMASAWSNLGVAGGGQALAVMAGAHALSSI